MSEEWPIRPPERESRAPAPAVGSDRLSVARRDFFLDPSYRLTEQERALMTAMLHRLVEDMAAELQALLPQEWLPANEDPDDLIRCLRIAGLLDSPELVELLLRRADEERIAAAVQARHGSQFSSVVQPLVSSHDAEIAAAAMGLLVARGKRRDRYAQPLIELDDLSPPTASQVVHSIAAALRDRKPISVSADEAERALCEAAEAIIARHDPAKSLDSLARKLFFLLDRASLLDEAWLRGAIDAGEISVLAHGLAVRVSLDVRLALSELLSGDCKRIMLLLRVAGATREFAGHLLATLADLLGVASEIDALRTFDSFTLERVESARGWLSLTLQFQEAMKALGHGNGNGSH